MAFLTATATERLSGPTVGVVGENPVEGKCVPIPACISCFCFSKYLRKLETQLSTNNSTTVGNRLMQISCKRNKEGKVGNVASGRTFLHSNISQKITTMMMMMINV